MASLLFVNLPSSERIDRMGRRPEADSYGSLSYPLDLCLCAALCERAGHEIQVLDCAARRIRVPEFLAYVKKLLPDLVFYIPSWPTMDVDANVLRQLKQAAPACRIAAMGSLAAHLGQQLLLACEALDYVLMGDMTAETVKLARYAEMPEKLSGIWIRKENIVMCTPGEAVREVVGECPFVTDLYARFLDIDEYSLPWARMPMVQLRTCFAGARRAPEQTVREIAQLKEKLPQIREIVFEDDDFTADPQWVLSFCDALIREGVYAVWSCRSGLAKNVDMLRRMHVTGCRMLYVDYLSGNEAVLEQNGRHEKLWDMLEFAKNAYAAGISVTGHFTLGLLGETDYSMNHTLYWVRRLCPEEAVIDWFAPLPGSEEYIEAAKRGILRTKSASRWLKTDGRAEWLLTQPQITPLQMEKLCARAERKHRRNPKRIMHHLLLGGFFADGLREMRKRVMHFYVCWKRREKVNKS